MSNKVDIEKVLRNNESIHIRIQGYSMTPLLYPERDSVIISPSGNVRRGDVILYRRKNGTLILHRIYKKSGNVVYCVGDGQSEIEGPINEEQIIGVMTSFIRKGKRVVVNNIIYRIYTNVWLLLRRRRSIFIKLKQYIHKVKGELNGKNREN